MPTRTSRQARATDVDAALYNEHKKSLQSYVRQRLPGADAAYAEDVVHETFARTIRHLNNGKMDEYAAEANTWRPGWVRGS